MFIGALPGYRQIKGMRIVLRFPAMSSAMITSLPCEPGLGWKMPRFCRVR